MNDSDEMVRDLEAEDARPWEKLERLIEAGRPSAVESFLDGLRWSERARAISRLDDDNQDRLLTMLSPEEAAELVETLPEHEAAELIERLEPGDAASIVEELDSDHQADVLGHLETESAEAIYAQMDPGEAAEARSLVEHDPQSAGGLMVTEFVTFRDDITVHDVFTGLRDRRSEIAEYDIQYLYVVDAIGHPVGVLRARDLLLAPASQKIAEVMIREVRVLPAELSLQEVAQIFEEHAYVGLPVVDKRGMLIGVVRRRAVDEALVDESDAAFLASKGIIGGEEYRTHPLGIRVRRRLSWLSLNVMLNLVSASVIALNQDTLREVVALAVFLPILSDMSGCAGQQAVAVSIRELTLGLVRHTEILRVVLKEVATGIINGLSLAVVVGLVAWAWDGNPYLGLVVGTAQGINIVISATAGGMLPLLVKRLGFDPALVSGLILTTVTDMCGFFLALTFAAQMLPYLK